MQKFKLPEPRDEFTPRYEFLARRDGLPGRVLAPREGFREEDMPRASSEVSTGEKKEAATLQFLSAPLTRLLP